MRRITVRRFILISLVLATPGLGQGDSRLRVARNWVLSRPAFEEEAYQANEKRAREGAFDSRAEGVLRAAESFTGAIFTSLSRGRIAAR
jgi:hypothetical protein